MSTSAVQAGADPRTWSRSPTSEARTGDWSTQVVERRWRKGASRRMRWTATVFQAVVITLASTAIIVPADPAKAAAVGTTQKLALGVTAHASSELWPALRSPRVTRVAPRRSHIPADSARGPKQLADRGQPPGRHQRECRRRGQDLDAEEDGPRPLHGRSPVRRAPPDEPTHHEPHKGEHTPIVAAARPGPIQLTPAGERIRFADAHATDARGACGGDCRASLAYAPFLPSLGRRHPHRRGAGRLRGTIPSH